MLSLLTKSTAARSATRLATSSARGLTRAFSTEYAEGEPAGYSLELSEEQSALKELAREFAMKEMMPVAAQYDQSMEFPQPVFEKAWEVHRTLGVPRSLVPC